MGMEIWLERPVYTTYDKIVFIEKTEYVFSKYIPSGNIDIAKKLKVYKAMWKSYTLNPDYKKGDDVQNYNVTAKVISNYLKIGVELINTKGIIPENDYRRIFLNILKKYYAACLKYPDAIVGIYCKNS